MQRVSALLPSWDKSRPHSVGSSANHKPRPSLPALDRVFSWADKSSISANRNSTPVAASTTTPKAPLRFGKETYWPTTLDKECEKAARILKSFCIDGFLAQDDPSSQPPSQASSQPPSPTAPASPKRSAKKIPPRIIQNAVGLAVFSCVRSGLWMSGSGGSGVLIARKADGTWSPPSGILLHTTMLGFALGVDIYDCVLVINSVAALEMFTRPRVVLGTDVGLTVGPLISAGLLENDVRWKELSNTVLTYLKAKGEHRHVRLDGSLVTQRGNENERFYDGDVQVLDVLAGNIRKSIPETRPLFEVIKAAEGRTDYDVPLMKFLAQQPAPGDAVIETPGTSPLSPPQTPFGIPSSEDPDPFGVIALEMAGLEIREAGTRLRPHSTQFEFSPTPTSPVYSKFSRQSTDTFISKSNRGSFMSSKTQATAVTDACTQTDDANSQETGPSHSNSDDAREHAPEKLPTVEEPDEVDYTKIDSSPIRHLSRQGTVSHRDVSSLPNDHEVGAVTEATTDHESTGVADNKPNVTPQDKQEEDIDELDAAPKDERDEDADDEDEDDDDVAIVYEVATAAPPTRTAIASTQVTKVVQAKGALVTIPKRIPPPLPVRSPARMSRASKSEYGDVSSLRSPTRDSFQSTRSPSLRASTPVADETAASPAGSPAASTRSTAAADGEMNVPLRGDEQTTVTHDGDGGRRPSTSDSQPRPSLDATPARPAPADESEHEPQTPRPGDGQSRPEASYDEEFNGADLAAVTATLSAGSTVVPVAQG